MECIHTYLCVIRARYQERTVGVPCNSIDTAKVALEIIRFCNLLDTNIMIITNFVEKYQAVSD